jgi:hypothetical protein
MTIGVAANLSDGAILGADSAIIITGRVELPGGVQDGVLKIYEQGERVFQLADLPIGVMVFGMATIGPRTIESYIHEFEAEEASGQALATRPLGEIAEQLGSFLEERYDEIMRSVLESELKLKYRDISADKIPQLGVVLAGYSLREPLSEVWEVHVPRLDKNPVNQCIRPQGGFGTNWFGQHDAITRFIKGFDPLLIDEIVDDLVKRYGIGPVGNELNLRIGQIASRHEYRIAFDAMPLMQGIEYVRFVLDMAISQHRFVIGAPACGGNPRIAVITRKGFKEILPGSRPYR